MNKFAAILIIASVLILAGTSIYFVFIEPNSETTIDEWKSVEQPLLIMDLRWNYFGTKIISTTPIQGIIAEVNELEYNDELIRVVFASGNDYFIDKPKEKLQAGDIITIDKHQIERTPCEIVQIVLSNSSAYRNTKSDIKFPGMQNRTHEELLEMRNTINIRGWLLDRMYSDVVPYDKYSTCDVYEDYSFRSLDKRISTEIIKDFIN